MLLIKCARRNFFVTPINARLSLMLLLIARRSRSYHGQPDPRKLLALGHNARIPRRTLASNSDEPEPKKKSIFNFFEQLAPGLGRKRVDPEDGGDFSKEAKALKDRIDQLGAEIAGLRGEGKLSLVEPLIATLSEEDQAKVRKALAEPDNEDDEDLDMSEVPISLIDLPKLASLGLRLELSPQQVIHLQNLDKRLREAADDISNAAIRRSLWRAYESAKRSLPPFLRLVPDSIFRVLWESQSNGSADDPRQAGHLCTIAADLSLSGKNLTNQQALLYIDALLREDRLHDVQLQWESYESRLARREETRSEYGLLGIHMFAQLGNPERAQVLALKLMSEAANDMISPILVPVIVAWVKRGDDGSIKNAWALYLRLREKLGSEIRVRDYDYLTLSFLNAGRTDVALAVFKDIMLFGQDHEYTSERLYGTSLGLAGRLQNQSVDLGQLNEISLTALTVLPRQFQNKYFYGSWMKHLIGIGETDAAASVVELMIERGVRPDSKHLNGIIGAWLRSSSAENRAKAEQLGWAMIRQRLDLVKKRRGEKIDQGNGIAGRPTWRVARYLRRRMLAPATIETFSLLLLDYERRMVDKHTEELKVSFSQAEIPPNSYWMNHVMYAELRQGRHNIAWDVYLHRPKHVSPDLESFACLWDCEKRHLDRLAVYPQDNFPGPRRILREMLSWYTGLGPTNRKDVLAEATRQLYDQILRCLCLHKDLEGTIVALYALKELFGFYPDQSTARMIMLQVARVAIGGEKSGRRRRKTLSAHGHSNDAVTKMTQVLEMVSEQRVEKLLLQGMDPREFDDDKRGQELAIVLATFLQIVMRETNGISTIADKIQQAALDSGAPSVSQKVELIAE